MFGAVTLSVRLFVLWHRYHHQSHVSCRYSLIRQCPVRPAAGSIPARPSSAAGLPTSTAVPRSAGLPTAAAGLRWVGFIRVSVCFYQQEALWALVDSHLVPFIYLFSQWCKSNSEDSSVGDDCSVVVPGGCKGIINKRELKDRLNEWIGDWSMGCEKYFSKGATGSTLALLLVPFP